MAAQLGSMVFAQLRDLHPAIHVHLQLGDWNGMLAVFASTPQGDYSLRLVSTDLLEHVHYTEVLAVHVAADLSARLVEQARAR